jgi:hypothetical protein
VLGAFKKPCESIEVSEVLVRGGDLYPQFAVTERGKPVYALRNENGVQAALGEGPFEALGHELFRPFQGEITDLLAVNGLPLYRIRHRRPCPWPKNKKGFASRESYEARDKVERLVRQDDGGYCYVESYQLYQVRVSYDAWNTGRETKDERPLGKFEDRVFYVHGNECIAKEEWERRRASRHEPASKQAVNFGGKRYVVTLEHELRGPNRIVVFKRPWSFHQTVCEKRFSRSSRMYVGEFDWIRVFDLIVARKKMLDDPVRRTLVYYNLRPRF